MKFPILRNIRVALLSMTVLALAACASASPDWVNIQATDRAPTSEAVRDQAATRAEITAHLSGMTFTSQTGEWHHASDGGVKAFDPPKDSHVVVGRWWVETAPGSDVLVHKTTTFRLKDGKVTEDGQQETHRVFIQTDGSVVLDRMVDGKPDGTTTRLWDARKGFPNEAAFASAEQRMSMGGTAGQVQTSRTDGASAGKTAGKIAAGAVGVTVLVALCVGSMFLLCPM